MSVQLTTAVKSNSIWRNKSFHALLGSVLLLTFGNKIYEIALPLLMYELTHSSVTVTSMRTAELLPNFLFAIVIGVLVDRVNKKYWLMWMIGSQAFLLFALVFLFKSNSMVISIYYLIGFLLMTFNYGYFNAQVSLTKLSVQPDQLTSANAKITFAETLISIMGPAIAGFILSLSDTSAGILITGICYFLCVILFFRISFKEVENRRVRSKFREDLRDGWLYFKSNKLLRTITVFVMFLNCTESVIATTIIIFAKEVLSLPSSLLAVLLSISGIGGLLGSLLVGKFRDRIGLGKVFGISAIINGFAYLVLVFANHTAVVLAIALFLSGFAASFYTISSYTIRQEQTPSRLMGRIAGITGTLYRVAMPIVMYLSGWMIVWWGTSFIFICSAVWNLVVFVVLVQTRVWKAA